MKIKKCPFCGSENLSVGNFGNYIKCINCGTAGPDGSTLNEAFDKWNAAPRKDDVEMEKNCGNCKYLKLGNKAKSKWYCTKALEDEYSSCKSWAPHNPFKPTQMTVCNECQYEYWDNGEHYCGKAIWNLDYSCPGWEAKEPEPAPLTPSNSRGLKTLCEKAISKWGEAAQINKAIEELLELAIALTRYQNLNIKDEDYQEKAYKILDNIHEEREDVEIMLRQLDVIFGRSEEWQHKKYEHLQAIVEDTEDD